jgi:hypothetical protein
MTESVIVSSARAITTLQPERTLINCTTSYFLVRLHKLCLGSVFLLFHSSSHTVDRELVRAEEVLYIIWFNAGKEMNEIFR